MNGDTAPEAGDPFSFVGVPEAPGAEPRSRDSTDDPVRRRLAAALGDFAGFRLPSGSEGALDDALRRCAAGRFGSDLDAYLRVVCEERDPSELALLFDAVSVGQTAFFRSGSTITDLVRHVAVVAAAHPGPIRIWSAGCASGEEVWSVAAVAVAALGPDADRLEVVGSDLSHPALELASRAAYPDVPLTAIPVGLRPLFESTEEGLVPVRKLRSVVRFERHNLVDGSELPVEAPIDAILFRNVGIYFDNAVVASLVRRFHEALRPGGYLLLGRAESLWGVDHPFEVVEVGSTFAYRRQDTEFVPRAPVEATTGPEGGPSPSVADRHRLGTAPCDELAHIEGVRRENAAEAIAALLGRIVSGRLEEAAAEAATLVRDHPLMPEAHYLLATVQDRCGDEQGAFESYRRSVYLDPGFALGHLGTASLLERRSETRRSAAAYAAAASHLLDDVQRYDPFLESMECTALHDMCVDKAMELRAAGDR